MAAIFDLFCGQPNQDGRHHLGLGKLAFRSVVVAKRCEEELNGVSIMGSKIGAVIDPRTDKLNQMREKILRDKVFKILWADCAKRQAFNLRKNSAN